MTFKQSQTEGWNVRKGEKASHIEFWDVKLGDKEVEDENGKRSKMIHRTYAVFNATQTDGIPPIELPNRKPFEAIDAAALLVCSEVSIKIQTPRHFQFANSLAEQFSDFCGFDRCRDE